MAPLEPARKILVIFVQLVPWGGGAERVVLDIARSLDRRCFDPVIYSLHQGAEPPVGLAAGIPYLQLEPRPNFFALLRSYYVRVYVRLLYPILTRVIYPIRYKVRLRTRCRNILSAYRAGKLWQLRRNYTDEVFLVDESPVGIRPSATDARTAALARQASLIADIAREKTGQGPCVFIAVMEHAASAVHLGLCGEDKPLAPYIVQTHAWESYYLPVIFRAPEHDYECEHARFENACKEAAAVTSPSRGCHVDLLDTFHVPPEKAVMLPNPVNFVAIRQALEQEFERPLPAAAEGKTLFICVGRYDPEKGHMALFDACQRLREWSDAFHLLCIGEGLYRTALENQLKKLNLQGHVTLFGSVDNPFPYYKQACAHVMASVSESFGMVYVEATACGCLNIATDTFGSRDVLDNGRCGVIVRQNAPEELAEAMYTVMTAPETVKETLRYGSEWIRQYRSEEIVARWSELITRASREYFM